MPPGTGSSVISNSSRETSYRRASKMRLSVSGEASARSHLDTACLLIPSLAASSSWDRLFFFRNCTKRLAISIFISRSILSRHSLPAGQNPFSSEFLKQIFRNHHTRVVAKTPPTNGFRGPQPLVAPLKWIVARFCRARNCQLLLAAIAILSYNIFIS